MLQRKREPVVLLIISLLLCVYPLSRINFSCTSTVPTDFLTYPVPACGKDTNWTVARRKISDVIGTLKCRHHVNSHLIMWAFFKHKMRNLMVSKKKTPLFVWEGDRKIHPSRFPIVITRQASWSQTVVLGTDFLSHPHTQDILYKRELACDCDISLFYCQHVSRWSIFHD